MDNAVHLHTAEHMPEVADGSVDLLIGGSVFLDTGTNWEPYAALYDQVYNREGLRVLAPDGLFVVVQTDAYSQGEFVPRMFHLMHTLHPDWVLIDRRVWQRRAADHMQVPFSDVMVFKRHGGRATRAMLNKRSKEWFQGVWQMPQGKGGAHNTWPPAMCEMVLIACTDQGHRVLDPFAGMAGLLAAAVAGGRYAVGYEIDPQFVPLYLKNGLSVVDGEGKVTPPAKTGLAW